LESKKFIFVVMTPLQYLNALEAQYEFMIPVQDSVLVIISSQKRGEMIRNILDTSRWLDVHSVDREEEALLTSKSTIIKYFIWFFKCLTFRSFTNKLNKLYPSPETVFISNYIQETHIHIANLLNPGNVVLLDDGNASLGIASNRLQNIQISETDRFRRGSKIRLFIKKNLLHYRLEFINSVTFFTVYDLQIRENDRIIKNSYKLLRHKFRDKTYMDCMYFLGGSFVENKIISLETFKNLMTQVKEKSGLMKIIYIKHPGEYLDSVDKALEDIGIETRRFNQPIELVLAAEEKVPSQVGAFLSSALFNIHTMAGDNFIIIAYRFPDNYITPDRREWANEIYSFLDSKSTSNLRIIDLN
jgi:hypothetical protein